VEAKLALAVRVELGPVGCLGEGLAQVAVMECWPDSVEKMKSLSCECLDASLCSRRNATRSGSMFTLRVTPVLIETRTAGRSFVGRESCLRTWIFAPFVSTSPRSDPKARSGAALTKEPRRRWAYRWTSSLPAGDLPPLARVMPGAIAPTSNLTIHASQKQTGLAGVVQ